MQTSISIRKYLQGDQPQPTQKIKNAVKKGQTTQAETFICLGIELYLQSTKETGNQKRTLDNANSLFGSLIKISSPDQNAVEIKRLHEQIRQLTNGERISQRQIDRLRLQLMNLNGLIERMSQSSILTDRTYDRKMARYTCPLTFQLMEDPANLPCGHLFDFEALKIRIERTRTCPQRGCQINCSQSDIRRCPEIRQQIQEFIEKVRRRDARRNQWLQIKYYHILYAQSQKIHQVIHQPNNEALFLVIQVLYKSQLL